MYDAFFIAPIQITQRLPFQRIWNNHRHIHEPAPENLGRRHGGDARTYLLSVWPGLTWVRSWTRKRRSVKGSVNFD
ncbi:hypothetical protein A2U01_0049697 [Trifolium medium]|uniref:Uncharacterized protein n=1 Tax=Trifolium medium TaxID=97028 RepID=A0A392QY98_9FABA|nr:hypothetical protein [Trifolium medium]